MSDPGLTSEQRAAIAVHNATQNRMCLNLSGNGQICVACSEVADQIDAAVEVERQRSQAALAAARRALLEISAGNLDNEPPDAFQGRACDVARAALVAPAAGEERINVAELFDPDGDEP